MCVCVCVCMGRGECVCRGEGVCVSGYVRVKVKECGRERVGERYVTL